MMMEFRLRATGMKINNQFHNALLAYAVTLFLGNAPTAWADFSALLDQSIIASHETFELTLRSDNDQGSTPDLQPLKRDFNILGTRQSRQMRIINGQSESWRDWIITLMPKRTGDLIIPSLALGSERSQPLHISVLNNLDDGTGSHTSPVFMLAEVNSENVYVQQEVVLTLQILYRVQLLEDSRLAPLTIEDSLVKQLGDTRQFETVVNNTRYKVFELTYSIHPQQTGNFTIPSLTFNGVAADSRDPFAGSFFSSAGKPVVARSPQITINVRPRPENYAANAWLPARNISLQESWSHSPDQLKVGDALTRTITVTADGLSSAQLPPVVLTTPQGINSYPDKSSSEDETTVKGVRGIRTDAIAMIPTKAGTLNLPEVRYTWFNTETGETEEAVIPQRTLKISGDSTAIASVPAVSEPTVDNNNKTEDCPVIVAPESGQGNLFWWKLSTLLLAFLWLGTASLWWFTRNNPASSTQTKPASKASSSKKINETGAFAKLEMACKKGNAQDVRNNLKQWCLLLLADKQLTSMAQCLEEIRSPQLNEFCRKLDARLYAGSKENIDFSELPSTCRSLRKQYTASATDDSMDDLYPTS